MNSYPTAESLIRSFSESNENHDQNMNKDDVTGVFPLVSLLSVVATTMDIARPHSEPSQVIESLLVPPLVTNVDGIPIQRACL